MNSRITINPQVCHGQACIQGTRIPVYQILRMLACGDSVEDLLQEYPSITREDILAGFDYVATLAEEQVTPLAQAGAAKRRKRNVGYHRPSGGSSGPS